KKTNSPRQRAQAFAALEQVLRQDPARTDIRRRQVDLAVALAQYTDAREHVQVLLRSAPNDAELEALLGQCELANKKYVEAASAYEKAVKHAPRKVENFIPLVKLYRVHLDNPKKADQIADLMVEANKGDFRAYLARARYRIDFEAQKPALLDKAAEDLTKAR